MGRRLTSLVWLLLSVALGNVLWHYLIHSKTTSPFETDQAGSAKLTKHRGSPKHTDNSLASCVSSLKARIERAWRGQVTVESHVDKPIACQQYDQDATRERHPLTDILNNRGKVKDESVTYVTHLSSNRIEVLTEILKIWTGPLSISLYTRPKEIYSVAVALCSLSAQIATRQILPAGINAGLSPAENAPDDIASHTINVPRHVGPGGRHPEVTSSPDLSHLNNLALHVVPVNGSYYPVNYMRSLALNHSASRYVFLCDGDLVPMQGLHGKLLHYAQRQNISEKKALVVPAFDWKQTDATEQRRLFPGNKTQLTQLLRNATLSIFQVKIKNTWIGQQATDYGKWMNATEPYKVAYIENYEPYIVMDRTLTPPYQLRFVGRYRDHSSHVYEISRAGFQFVVLPDVFVVHKPHVTGNAQQLASLYFRCAVKQYDAFKKEMDRKYPKISTDIGR